MSPNHSSDRISKLPDEIIHHILSRMPTKDALATCNLSSRWRQVWSSYPVLALNFCDFRCHSTNRLSSFMSFSCGILRRHDDNFPLHELRIGLCGNHIDITNLIEHSVKCRTHKILLVNDSDFVLPSSLFLSKSLKVLKLDFYQADPQFPPGPVNFPCLEKLSLRMESLTEELLNNFMSACPSMLELCVNHRYGTPESRRDCKELRICHPKLESIKLKNFLHVERCEIDAPSLHSLELKHVKMDLDKVDISSCKQLKHLTFAFIWGLKEQDIEGYAFEFSNLETLLLIKCDVGNLKISSPSLRTLVLCRLPSCKNRTINAPNLNSLCYTHYGLRDGLNLLNAGKVFEADLFFPQAVDLKLLKKLKNCKTLGLQCKSLLIQELKDHFDSRLSKPSQLEEVEEHDEKVTVEAVFENTPCLETLFIYGHCVSNGYQELQYVRRGSDIIRGVNKSSSLSGHHGLRRDQICLFKELRH